MKNKIPVLESDNLILKRGTIEDYKKVYEYDYKYLTGMYGPIEYKPFDSNLLEDYYNYANEVDEVYDWIVYTKNNEAIANIVADRVDHENNSIELAFNLHPTYWGNGYMKEALIEVMGYLYDLGYDKIIYGYIDNNEKSRKLNEKLGFTYTHIVPNAYEVNGENYTEIYTEMTKDHYNELYKNRSKKR